MIAAVVPTLHEEKRIGRVLTGLLSIAAVSKVFVILNGSNELTRMAAGTAYAKNRGRITLVSFAEPLGIDVPRAVGAKLAHTAGAQYTLFIDGDMSGNLTEEISRLIAAAVAKKLDLALVDCYPQNQALQNLNEPIFMHRRLLNQTLGIFSGIGIATPSHGPHLVSRRMLSSVPWEDFAVPPTLLAHAVSQKFNVGIAGAIPHFLLGSPIKNGAHSHLIIETIVGDCLEALCMARRIPRERTDGEKTYIGYHDTRRFDLLSQFLAGRFMR